MDPFNFQVLASLELFIFTSILHFVRWSGKSSCLQRKAALPESIHDGNNAGVHRSPHVPRRRCFIDHPGLTEAHVLFLAAMSFLAAVTRMALLATMDPGASAAVAVVAAYANWI